MRRGSPPHFGVYAFFGVWVVVAPSSVTAIGRDTFPPWGKVGGAEPATPCEE